MKARLIHLYAALVRFFARLLKARPAPTVPSSFAKSKLVRTKDNDPERQARQRAKRREKIERQLQLEMRHYNEKQNARLLERQLTVLQPRRAATLNGRHLVPTSSK